MIDQRDDKPHTPCTAHPDLFFPEANAPAKFYRAQEICMRCPKRAACLAYATSTNQQHGVWGGKNFGIPVRGERRPIEYAADGWPLEVPRDRYPAKYCKSGAHEFTQENTLWVRQHGTIARSCRACRRNYKLAKKHRSVLVA